MLKTLKINSDYPQTSDNGASLKAKPLLRAENLVKKYGSVSVLSGLSLTIHKGETVAIMGPSGSGKTTLLHLLAGILQADSGRILLLGQEEEVADLDLTSLGSDKLSRLRLEQFGFVFQEGLLLPELTMIENVYLPHMVLTNKIQQSKHKASRLLTRMGLADIEDRRPGQVSGGQAQRVAIARALINSPKIIFADEPTGALDSKTANYVLEELIRVCRNEGSAIVLVTHDERVAAKCHRIINILDGQIKEEVVNGK